MDRREILRLSGVGALAAFAGCQGVIDGEDRSTTTSTTRTPSVTTTDGPAQFRDVRIDLPENPTVGESLRVRVGATNYGGQPGTFTDTLVVDGPAAAEEPVEITDVDPGHRGVTTVEPTAWLSGHYRFRLADRDIETATELGPRSGDVGDTLARGEDLRFTLEDVTFHSPIALYNEQEEFAAALPAAGSGSEAILTVFRVTVENEGDSPYEVDPGTFEIPLRSDRTRLYFQDGDEDRSAWTYDDLAEMRLDRSRIVGETVRPGTSRNGLVLGQVNYADAHGAVPFGVQLDLERDPELVWTDSPEGGRRRLPRFEVTDVTLPSNPTINTEANYEITVVNSGGRGGTFRGLLEYHRPDYSVRSLALLEGSLDPGETTTFTGSISFPYVREYDLRLYPFGELGTVSTERSVQPFNTSFTTHDGIELIVSTPIRTREVQFGQDTEQLNINSEPDREFVSVGIQATIQDEVNGEIDEVLPDYDDFVIPISNNNYAFDIRVWARENNLDATLRGIESHGSRMEDPYEGPLWPDDPSNQIEGNQFRGFIPFYIPNDLSEEDTEIQLRFEDGNRQLIISNWRSPS